MVKCKQCGAAKANKGAWCPNYRSHGEQVYMRELYTRICRERRRPKQRS